MTLDIKELRDLLNISQREMAKRLGVAPNTISRVENDLAKLSEQLNGKIKEVFGVDLFAQQPAKEEPADRKPPAEEKKPAAPKTKIVIQSPMGGNITTKEILDKLPEDTDCVFVRVDQNKLWWIKGEETGSTEIWE